MSVKVRNIENIHPTWKFLNGNLEEVHNRACISAEDFNNNSCFGKERWPTGGRKKSAVHYHVEWAAKNNISIVMAEVHEVYFG